MVYEKITKLKDEYKENMDIYDDIIRDFVEENGSNHSNCDYITHRRSMASYYRGGWNALNKLQQEIS